MMLDLQQSVSINIAIRSDDVIFIIIIIKKKNIIIVGRLALSDYFFSLLFHQKDR